MALDGLFLSCLKQEIEKRALDTRVEKIYQPVREEIILSLRGRNGTGKLLLSAKADSARIQFTQYTPENPAVPPMFCMLLRKRLSGARLSGVRQIGAERALFLDFDATDELGDKVRYTLVIEIMARHSNIILIDGAGTIIDSVKRVDFTKSSVREILPGLAYQLPPAQEKMNLLTDDMDAVTERITNSGKLLSNSIQNTVQGLSPVLCSEISFVSQGSDERADKADGARLKEQLLRVKNSAAHAPIPIVLLDVDGAAKDFTFMRLMQFGDFGTQREFPSFSELLDYFYFECERTGRIYQRSQALFKKLTTLAERAARTAEVRSRQLKDCENKEQYKKYGDLINGHLYELEKGVPFYDVQNYFDEGMAMVRIPCDPALTPAQNAQKYYKEYRKQQTAETMLAGLIEESEAEAQYLQSILDLLSRAETEREIAAIREELMQQGYIRHAPTGKKKQPKALPPLKFMSSDGFRIAVGRNNVQNDKLTFREARNYDLWLHTKAIHGSHVIVFSDNREISETAIFEAACLAAYHSKAAGGSNVPVDYTLVKNVKKPNGAKPGFVIYETNETIYVTPSRELAEKLKADEVK